MGFCRDEDGIICHVGIYAGGGSWIDCGRKGTVSLAPQAEMDGLNGRHQSLILGSSRYFGNYLAGTGETGAVSPAVPKDGEN